MKEYKSAKIRRREMQYNYKSDNKKFKKNQLTFAAKCGIINI